MLVKLTQPITFKKIIRAIRYRADREAYFYRLVLIALHRWISEVEAEIARGVGEDRALERSVECRELGELVYYCREAISGRRGDA